MNPKISVIIPNFNGEKTLEHCLKALFTSDYDNFEVIVVDDNSDDRSVDVIKRFPCRLIQLPEQRGASAARNAGARESQGPILFFMDSDCVSHRNTLAVASRTLLANGPDAVIGGTYQLQSFDNLFYSRFQSVFIHYSETKKPQSPDYIATHAMAIFKETFLSSGGFKEQWLPILEDVEFSHRLRRAGHRFLINPNLLVQHIFNFSLTKSFRNAVRKTRYWTQYSIANKDLFGDSGTASHELKTNVVLFYASLLCLALATVNSSVFIPLFFALALVNLYINQRLIAAFYNAYGILFSMRAVVYYFCFYPIPVTIGGLMGVSSYFRKSIPQIMKA